MKQVLCSSCSKAISPHYFSLLCEAEPICKQCIERMNLCPEIRTRRYVRVPESYDDPSMAQQYHEKYENTFKRPAMIGTYALRDKHNALDGLIGCAVMQATDMSIQPMNYLDEFLYRERIIFRFVDGSQWIVCRERKWYGNYTLLAQNVALAAGEEYEPYIEEKS